MTDAHDRQRLGEAVTRRARRLRRAAEDQPGLLAQTVFLGTLGLLFVVPVVGGAYLGLWLDGMAQGWSVRWTVGLILLGVVVGAVNVYLFVRER